IGGAGAAANALYAFGQLQAIGFCPFGIDGPPSGRAQNKPDDKRDDKPDEANAPLVSGYAVLGELAPLVLQKQAEGKIATVLLEGEAQRAGRVSLGDYTFTAVRSNPADPEKRGAAMLLQNGPDEFIVAGSGDLTITFSATTPGPPIVGIDSIDEQVLKDGKWIQGRRLNGDENGQGQVLRIERSRSSTIFRLRLYRYR